MADASQGATTSLASQEATRVALDRARRESRGAASEDGATRPVGIDSGVLRVPFAGRVAKALQDQGIARIGPGGDGTGQDDADGSAGPPMSRAEAATRERIAAQSARSRNLGLGGAAQTGVNAAANKTDRLLNQDDPRSREEALKSELTRLRNARGNDASGGGPLGSLRRLKNSRQQAQTQKALKNLRRQQMGAYLIRVCWGSLLPSFGLTVFILDILFIAGACSSFMRQFIPEMGHEWLSGPARSTVPKSMLVPLKYAELTALIVVTGLLLAILILSLVQFIAIVSMVAGVLGG